MLIKQRLGLQHQHWGALGHMIVMGKLASGVVQSAGQEIQKGRRV